MPSLALGAAGPNVRDLQAALAREGLYRGALDGKFGAGTDAAVRAYQAQRGLTVDGKAGAKTLQALGVRDEFLATLPPTGAARGLPGLFAETRDHVRYGAVSGDLFVGGATVNDVMQGELGDCYFLAAVAATLNTNPTAITDLIRDNGDGTYSVRFFGQGNAQQTVTVDRQLPLNVDTDELAYGRSRQRGELWLAILEKAYATWKGSYQKIDGGDAGDALRELTGRAARSVDDVSEVPADTLWGLLERNAAAGKPICIGTWSADDAPRSRVAEYHRLGLVEDHAYAVLGVSEQNGERFVTLRDPSGDREAGMGRDGALDGRFTLRFAEVRRLFADLQLGT